MADIMGTPTASGVPLEPLLIRHLRRGERRFVVLMFVIGLMTSACFVGTIVQGDIGEFAWGLAVVTTLIVAGCLWAAVSSLRHDVAERPNTLRICEGVRMSLPELARALDRELGSIPLRDDDFKFLTSWIWKTGDIEVIPYERVAWAYKKLSRGRVSLVMRVVEYKGGGSEREGWLRVVEHNAADREVDALLEELARRVPWATFGFDPAFGDAEVLRRYEERRAALAQRPIA